jgi:hypothetical protein
MIVGAGLAPLIHKQATVVSVAGAESAARWGLIKLHLKFTMALSQMVTRYVTNATDAGALIRAIYTQAQGRIMFRT